MTLCPRTTHTPFLARDGKGTRPESDVQRRQTRQLLRWAWLMPGSSEPAVEPRRGRSLIRKRSGSQKRERLTAVRADAAGGAYPVSVPVTDTIPELRTWFGDLETSAETGVTAAVSGRVVFTRNTGKLCFATLQSGDGSRIQAMVSLTVVGEESLQAWKEFVDLGDHVFVSGQVISSRRGELSMLGVGVAHRHEGDPASAEHTLRAQRKEQGCAVASST